MDETIEMATGQENDDDMILTLPIRSDIITNDCISSTSDNCCAETVGNDGKSDALTQTDLDMALLKEMEVEFAATIKPKITKIEDITQDIKAEEADSQSNYDTDLKLPNIETESFLKHSYLYTQTPHRDIDNFMNQHKAKIRVGLSKNRSTRKRLVRKSVKRPSFDESKVKIEQ